jgi:tetratricopeptide (TPR) repeat protein
LLVDRLRDVPGYRWERHDFAAVPSSFGVAALPLRPACQQAVSLHAALGQRHTEALALDSLGYAEQHLDNLAEATACYQRALSGAREFGDRYAEAKILTHLGDTHHACGEQQQARRAWQQALNILSDLHHPDNDQVRGKLQSPA